MPAANGLFAEGGWIQSPRDIEFASKGAFRFRELKTEIRDIFSCFLRPDYKGEFADDVIESRTLVDTGVTPGTYNNVTVNSKGQVETATLKDPLGDPIHSPGGSGFIDCGDIPVPNVTVKGFTRTHVDPFGRVIEGDCVSPHMTGTPVKYDECDVDQHGRVATGTFNNFKQQIIDVQQQVDDLESELSGGSGYFDIGGKRFAWVTGSNNNTEVSQNINYPVSFASVEAVIVSTNYPDCDSTTNAHYQVCSFNTSSATVFCQNDAGGFSGSVSPTIFVIGTTP